MQEEENDTIVHQLSTPREVKKSLKSLPREVKKSLKPYQEALEKQPITSNIIKQQQIQFLSGSLFMETMKGLTQRR